MPSEGVFAMSSDEDVSSGPGGVVLARALFAPAPVTPRAPAPVPVLGPVPVAALGGGVSSEGASLTAEQKAGYFASSMFQNSPSPEELPDPLLL